MAKYFDVHPDNPQPRTIAQVADSIRADALIAYPTDSCYALGCRLGSRDGIERIRTIRHLDDRHHFTLVCQDFAQLGQFVRVDNDVFRAIKASTPGSYTFILPATKEVPRMLQHPKKKTVGVRIPDHVVTQALLSELGEPLLSSTLLLPDEDEPMTQGWEIKDRLDHVLDAVVDSGDCGTEPTTVINFSEGEAEIVRRGPGTSAGSNDGVGGGAGGLTAGRMARATMTRTGRDRPVGPTRRFTAEYASTQRGSPPMTSVQGTAVDIPTEDGVADAYVAHAADGGPRPGVLLYQDAFGLRPHLTSMADRIAEAGYTVLVPNVFYRHGRSPVVELPEFIDPEARPEIWGRSGR